MERPLSLPTNIAGMSLVMGCPNDRAGVKIVGGKKEPLEQPRATQTSIPSLITTSAVGVALVVPIYWLGLLAGRAFPR